MSNWWTGSPYWYVGIYIGGSNRFCQNNTNLTASWVSDVNSNGMNWSFIPIYVGLQDPCAGFQNSFSSNSATAQNEGSNAADYAISDAQNLGFTDSIIYFDLEGWGGTGGTCLSSAEAFVTGWVTEMQSRGWTGGLYGSASGSRMDDMYGLNPRPTDAFIAWPVASSNNSWNSPWAIYSNPYGVPNSDWREDHRIHQYNFDSTCETHGGICLTVDRNCAIGKTAKAWSLSTENSEPSGSTESDGSGEDVPPCGS